MKNTHLLILLVSLIIGGNCDAQILKKLKKRAEKAAERTILKKTDEKVSKTTEKVIDSITKVDNTKVTPDPSEPVNQALSVNTDLKHQFYTSDIIVKMFQEGLPSQTLYFDSDEIAARNEFHKMEKSPMFFDSEGFSYAYNVENQYYEKSGLMVSGPMSMMVPMQLVESYKLPSEPFYNALEEFKEKGLRLNSFNVIEFAFIYQPMHFEGQDYAKSIEACGTEKCTKFGNNLQGYEGSYVLFDSNNRLKEIYININNHQGEGTGKLIYNYESCEVKIPPSVEIKTPGEDLFNIGLDPTKN